MEERDELVNSLSATRQDLELAYSREQEMAECWRATCEELEVVKGQCVGNRPCPCGPTSRLWRSHLTSLCPAGARAVVAMKVERRTKVGASRAKILCATFNCWGPGLFP